MTERKVPPQKLCRALSRDEIVGPRLLEGGGIHATYYPLFCPTLYKKTEKNMEMAILQPRCYLQKNSSGTYAAAAEIWDNVTNFPIISM